MRKQDFKLMHEVALAVPKMMEMNDTMFIATICTYAIAHDIDISELNARITINLLCDELKSDEDDNDKE